MCFSHFLASWAMALLEVFVLTMLLSPLSPLSPRAHTPSFLAFQLTSILSIPDNIRRTRSFLPTCTLSGSCDAMSWTNGSKKV
jgi:hypothetical protein